MDTRCAVISSLVAFRKGSEINGRVRKKDCWMTDSVSPWRAIIRLRSTGRASTHEKRPPYSSLLSRTLSMMAQNSVEKESNGMDSFCGSVTFLYASFDKSQYMRNRISVGLLNSR